MNTAQAINIFKHIRNSEYSIEEKGLAIYKVLQMATHNSVTKDDFKTALAWLLNEHFEIKDN